MLSESIMGGKGYYNFDISFYESLDAVNNYSCVHSSMQLFFKDKFVNMRKNACVKVGLC